MTTHAITLDVSGLTCGVCIGDVLECVHTQPSVVEVTVGPVKDGMSRVRVLLESTTRVAVLAAALAEDGFGVAAR